MVETAPFHLRHATMRHRPAWTEAGRVVLGLVGATAIVVGARYGIHTKATAFSIFIVAAAVSFYLAYRFRRSNPMANMLLIAGTCSLCLAAFEAGTALMLYRSWASAASGWTSPFPKGYIARHEALGYAPAAPGSFHVVKRVDDRVIYETDYTITPGLYRDTPRSSPSAPTTVFFGCSFTFGEGLADDEALPYHYLALVEGDQRVVNLGFHGYGPHHMLKILQDGTYAAAIGSEVKAVVLQTAAFHINRVAGIEGHPGNPRFKLEGDEVVYAGPMYSLSDRLLVKLLNQGFATSKFIKPIFFHAKVTAEDVSLYVAIVKKAEEIIRARYGIPLTVLYLDGYDENASGIGFTDAKIRALLELAGLKVVEAGLQDSSPSLKPLLQIPGDGHPTSLANKLRAEVLYAAMNAP